MQIGHWKSLFTTRVTAASSGPSTQSASLTSGKRLSSDGSGVDSMLKGAQFGPSSVDPGVADGETTAAEVSAAYSVSAGKVV